MIIYNVGLVWILNEIKENFEHQTIWINPPTYFEQTKDWLNNKLQHTSWAIQFPVAHHRNVHNQITVQNHQSIWSANLFWNYQLMELSDKSRYVKSFAAWLCPIRCNKKITNLTTPKCIYVRTYCRWALRPRTGRTQLNSILCEFHAHVHTFIFNVLMLMPITSKWPFE